MMSYETGQENPNVGFNTFIEILLNIKDEEWLLGWSLHHMKKYLLFGEKVKEHKFKP